MKAGSSFIEEALAFKQVECGPCLPGKVWTSRGGLKEANYKARNRSGK